jgi:hypothetical protein
MGGSYTLQFGHQFTTDGIELFAAEISKDYPYPLVLVWYSINGKKKEKGLRLDLDKEVFLDHLHDEEKDAAIQALAPRVAEYVAQRLYLART